MRLQVELVDLRMMLKEKCEEIIADTKLAYEFYWRICDIEEDDRFKIVDNSLDNKTKYNPDCKDCNPEDPGECQICRER